MELGLVLAWLLGGYLWWQFAGTHKRREAPSATRKASLTERSSVPTLPDPRWPQWTMLRAALAIALVASAVLVTTAETFLAWLIQWEWKTPPHPDDRRAAAMLMLSGGLPIVLASITVALLRKTRQWFVAVGLAVALTLFLSLTFLTGRTDPAGLGVGWEPPVWSAQRVVGDRGLRLPFRLGFYAFWTHVVIATTVGLDTLRRRHRVRGGEARQPSP